MEKREIYIYASDCVHDEIMKLREVDDPCNERITKLEEVLEYLDNEANNG